MASKVRIISQKNEKEERIHVEVNRYYNSSSNKQYSNSNSNSTNTGSSRSNSSSSINSGITGNSCSISNNILYRIVKVHI